MYAVVLLVTAATTVKKLHAVVIHVLIMVPVRTLVPLTSALVLPDTLEITVK